MKVDNHQAKALREEQSIDDLGDPALKPYNGDVLIEAYWGAAFNWIAYGCHRKHGQHKENHRKLPKYLRDLGENLVADAWEALDKKREGGFYNDHATLSDVLDTRRYWQEIRT